MSPIGRRATFVSAGLAGVAAGVVLTLTFTGPDGPDPASSSPPTASTESTESTASTTPSSSVTASEPDPVLLIWTSGGLPAGLATDVASLPGVEEVTLVRGDQTAMVRSSIDDRVVEEHLDGWRIPLDTLAIEPAGFAAFVAEPAGELVRDLQLGEALLTKTSAEVRGLGVGGRLELEGGEVTVRGIIDDLDALCD